MHGAVVAAEEHRAVDGVHVQGGGHADAVGRRQRGEAFAGGEGPARQGRTSHGMAVPRDQEGPKS